MSRPSAAILEAMWQDRRAGLSFRVIGARHGRTKGSVEWWLSRKFKKRPASKWKAAMADRNERIVTLAMRGVDVKRIAHSAGLTYQAVWRVARRHGVKRTTELKRKRALAWKRQHEAGEPMAAIGRREGVPASTVRSAVERLEKKISGPCRPTEAARLIVKPASVESTIRSEAS